MVGRIVSVGMSHTAVVLVKNQKRHPLYKKTFNVSKKFLANDDLGVKVGDLVEIIKIRPISKRKHWMVTKVVGRNIEELVSEQLQKQAAEIVAEVMPEEIESSDKSPVEDEARQRRKESSEEEVKTQMSKVKSTAKKLKVDKKKGTETSL